jgi:hypothetical protein
MNVEIISFLKKFRLDQRHTESAYQRLIVNKNILQDVSILIDNLTLNVRPNIFLFSLYVYHHPIVVDNDEYCIALSNSIYNWIFENSKPKDIIKLNSYLILFDKSVKNFCKKDKEECVKFSIEYYNSLENTKNFLDPTNFKEIEEIEKLQTKIENSLRKIYQVEVKDHLVYINKEDVHNKLINVITNNMEKAYWDMMDQQIKNNNFDMLISSLIEIKDMLKDFIDSSFPPLTSIKSSEVDDRIDIEFITILIERNVYEKSNLLSLIEFICFVIFEVSSKNRKDESQKLRDNCINRILSIENWNNQELSDALTFCLREIYKRLKCFIKIN